MSAIVQTQSLAKTFTSQGVATAAVRQIDLQIMRGDFVALMGPSGCGKSTLLHLLGGLDRPTNGEIHLAGKRVDHLNETQWAVLRRREIGFMFQAFNLIGNLTVADNVELPSLMAGFTPREARSRREALLARLGLAEKMDAIPAQLSGGQQQRVALARALINQPHLLLADEPTGNLDSQSTLEVLRLLREANAAGQTIFLVTHDPRVADAANRVVQMRDGAFVN
ncbi:MAG TPA: ABC transporter ATP-binding protein [Anaerolineales bacterium]|nr:ABC transporter ATP-binding protein [Anaerolineales bacterium]